MKGKEKKPKSTYLRNLLDVMREWQRRDILPNLVIRRVQKTNLIDRSFFLFDKFYQLNILHDSGDINDL